MENEQSDAAIQRWRRMSQPMPARQAALPFERAFAQENWRKVALGVVLRKMEDLW
jgi:hypothetical protein